MNVLIALLVVSGGLHLASAGAFFWLIRQLRRARSARIERGSLDSFDVPPPVPYDGPIHVPAVASDPSLDTVPMPATPPRPTTAVMPVFTTIAPGPLPAAALPTAEIALPWAGRRPRTIPASALTQRYWAEREAVR